MKTVLIVLDTLRRDYLEPYGSTWVRTPAMAKFAAEGITFTNHWVGSLPCMPARREFMTGRHNFLYRNWGPIEPYDDVLPRELRKQNVFSHLITDHYHYFELGGENYHTAFNTWDFYRGQEHDPWASLVDGMALPEHMGQATALNLQNRSRQVREEDFSGPRTIAAAIDWLRDNHHADNWFLQVELFDPHEPFYCTDEYREMYGDSWTGPLFDWPTYSEVTENPDAVEHIRKCYAGLISMSDKWVGRLLQEMQQMGRLEDTLIILTTDHGTMLAEHNYWMKNRMPMYNEIVRIPLMMRLPGGDMAGTTCNGLTQTVDIMPTILNHHGCTLPPFQTGIPLQATIRGEAVRDCAIFGYFGMALNITDGRYVYMRHPIREDGGPLHAYTAMPVGGLNHWYPRELNGQIEMGRYFSHTYNLPLYKIPATGSAPAPLRGEASYVGRHLLYDILTDPLQEDCIEDPAIEEAFIGQINKVLRRYEAPAEQYLRLGLTPPQSQ